MNWTQTVPTVPGLYWFVRAGWSHPEVVQLGTNGKGNWWIFYLGSDEDDGPARAGDWWMGPLTVPDMPVETAK